MRVSAGGQTQSDGGIVRLSNGTAKGTADLVPPCPSSLGRLALPSGQSSRT